MIGAGGPTLEAQRDIAMAIGFPDRRRVKACLAETGCGRWLLGSLGSRLVNTELLVDIALKAVTVARDMSESFAALDFNPVVIGPWGAAVVDAKLHVKTGGPGTEWRTSMHTVEIDYPLEGVGRITLNRPHVLNAINHELLDDFVDGDERARARHKSEVHHPQRCRPRLFGRLRPEGRGGRGSTACRGVGRPLPVLTGTSSSGSGRAPNPTWRPSSGYDLGGALELSLLADVTLAARSAQFGLPEIRHGGGPGATMLPWVVGMKAAKWLMLTGMRIGAERALELGLVTEVVDDDLLESRSLEVAGELAAIPPTALKFTKLALNRTYERMGFLGAVDENYTISTVMNATAAYRNRSSSANRCRSRNS